MPDTKCSACGGEISATFRYCPHCGRDLTQPIICPQCQYSNEPNSKFCQECGSPLSATRPSGGAKRDRATLEPVASEPIEPPPKHGITLEFPYTSAQSFDIALEEARRLPTFMQYGKEKKAIYRVTVATGEIASLAALLEDLKGWRKRTVYLDGEKVPWEAVFAYTWCHVKKAASYKPEYYCYGYENEYELNPWGCIHARLPFTESADWFCWGEWLNSRPDWKFDKDRIRHELEKNLFPVRFCPAMVTDRVQAVLAALPDVVNPNKDKNWKFAESFDEAVTNGIKVRIERFGYKEDVVMKGAPPNGRGALLQIINKAKLNLPIK